MIMLFTARHESGIGTFETCRRVLRMSAYRGKPEVVGSRENDANEGQTVLAGTRLEV